MVPCESARPDDGVHRTVSGQIEDGAIASAFPAHHLARLYAYRDGDANMRSVWLCTRNDMIGNVAVVFAALGVFGTGSPWPDIAVAAVMGVLALRAARTVIAHARRELQVVAA